jgi:N-acetylmuramoyl-L-alanine amidase
MDAFVTLATEILTRYPIPPQRILGHSDVAPSRRCDPGELFDWEGVAASGIGVWPEAFSSQPPGSDVALAPGSLGGEVQSMQECLALFGYGIELTAKFDEPTQDVVMAFQRHFRAMRVDGIADSETRHRLEVLAEQYG